MVLHEGTVLHQSFAFLLRYAEQDLSLSESHFECMSMQGTSKNSFMVDLNVPGPLCMPMLLTYIHACMPSRLWKQLSNCTVLYVYAVARLEIN